MLIGQLVAISYASALFWGVCEATSPKQKDLVYASRRLVWTTITATTTTFFLYSCISTAYFLPLLLAVHLLLILPLVESAEAPSPSLSIVRLYAINGILSTVLHWSNCLLLLHRGGWYSIFAVIAEDPAMSSIGWDIICCAFIGVVATRRIESVTLPIAISQGGTMAAIISLLPPQNSMRKEKSDELLHED